MRLFSPQLSRPFRLILAALCLLTIVARNVVERAWSAHVSPGELQVEQLVPGAVRVERAGRPGVWFVYDATGERGLAFETALNEPAVRGYRGPINALVGMGADGLISAVALLDHQETPYYMGMLLEQRFTEALIGLELQGPDPVPSQIDAISGATISSRALSRDVFLSGHTVLSEELGLQVHDSTERTNLFRPLLALAVLSLAVLALALRRRAPWLRWLSWIADLLILGIVLQTVLSFAQLADLLAGRPPGRLNLELALIMVAALVGSLIVPRFYCRSVCPFGALQEMLARLSGRALRPGQGAGAAAGALTQLPYFVLAGLVLAVFGAGLWAVAPFEPYALLFSGQFDALILLYAALAALPSIFFPRFYCRFLCPTGACLGLVSRLTRPRKTDWLSAEQEHADEV